MQPSDKPQAPPPALVYYHLAMKAVTGQGRWCGMMAAVAPFQIHDCLRRAYRKSASMGGFKDRSRINERILISEYRLYSAQYFASVFGRKCKVL